MFKLGVAQINPELNDLKSNKEKHLSLLERAISEKVNVLVFPELSLTGYYLLDGVAEASLPLNSPFLNDFKKISEKISFALGMIEKGTDYNPYISQLFFEDGEIKGVHRKVYLPTHGIFEDLKYFARGKKVEVINSHHGKTGMLICRDFMHLSLNLLLYLQGVNVLLLSSAIPVRGLDKEKGFSVKESVEYLLRSLANYLNVYIAFSSRGGFEEGIAFMGSSLILNNYGYIVREGVFLEEDFLTYPVNLEEIYKKNITFPLLRGEDLLMIKENMRFIGNDKPEL
ncbi:MAG: N-carbamoyl-D-amino acid hydrolase [candidate division WS2 bacterium]|uniref:N-carbamoyl-D-amino acid hydrolase n=1 Tax=Psychracetigena formicireducens TaxID=2986056 RepID=A0A9E2BM19_PSYF1|nr:N-carbamoyl-D-amino acid hydrolase [Candidatus Psychracetigena formicireducens]